jgi:hypothetical protein
MVAPSGFEPLLGGSGESRPLLIRVILQGFIAHCIPACTLHFRPFPTPPLENVRKRSPSGAIPREAELDVIPKVTLARRYLRMPVSTAAAVREAARCHLRGSSVRTGRSAVVLQSRR